MPIETIYINRLEEKVPISKLKLTIRRVFGQCGTIISIEANSSLKRRGQVFVTYSKKEESKAAIERFQDFRLFRNPIKVSYAHSTSDKILRLNGEMDKIQERRRLRKKRANAAAAAFAIAAKKQHMKSTNHSETPIAPTTPVKAQGTLNVTEWKLLPPHNVLLLQGISSQHTKDTICKIFESSNGFTNVRYVGVRRLAFIEFETEAMATACLETIEGMIQQEFGNDALLSYAKK